MRKKREKRKKNEEKKKERKEMIGYYRHFTIFNYHKESFNQTFHQIALSPSLELLVELR
jgi:hypothetical protein